MDKKNSNKKEDKTRILFIYKGICDVMLDRKGHGGAEVQLYLLAKELAKDNKYRIIITNFKENNEAFDKIKYFEILSFTKNYKDDVKKSNSAKSDSTIDVIKSSLIRKFHRMLHIFHVTRDIIKSNPDIIITRTAGKYVFRSMLLSKILRKKFIFMTAHDWDCNGEYERRNKTNDMLYREGLVYSDLVICQNTYQKTELKKNYNKDSMIINSMYPVPDVKDKKRKYVLWIGRCEKWKRPEAFIELARLNPKYKFLMISACANNEKVFFEETMKLAKNIKNLEVKEYVPFSEIDKVFKEAILFVNTSTYEGFPNTFVQSAKNKTPVLSLNVKPNDLFNKYRIGFCAEDDMSAFKSTFKKMMNDKKLLKELGSNGFKYARKEHDIRNIVKIYDKIFSSLKHNKKLDESTILDAQ